MCSKVFVYVHKGTVYAALYATSAMPGMLLDIKEDVTAILILLVILAVLVTSTVAGKFSLQDIVHCLRIA